LNKYKGENKSNKIFDALVYIIIIATLLMIAPLIHRFASNYSFGSPAALLEGEHFGGRGDLRSRRYAEPVKINLPLASLRETPHGRLNLLAARITDSGSVIMFCDSPSEYSERLGRATRIAVLNAESYANHGGYPYNLDYDYLAFFPRILRWGLDGSIRAGDYVFKDYSDGNIFISNSRTAFLFDYNELRFAAHYALPEGLNIYQAALSNNREMLAIAAEEGFFVREASPDAPLIELIASSSPGGVLITAREPFWSSGDDYIFYKIYADEYIRNAGMTTVTPGGNQQLMALDSTNFIFLDNDAIFYYFSSGSAPYQENLFRCGFFDPFGDRRMTDSMRSQVYYFDIAVSPRGTLLAALSHNGNMTRLIILDIRTKQQVYSALYDAVHSFSFSPNERNFILHGRANGEQVLHAIKIDWEEDTN